MQTFTLPLALCALSRADLTPGTDMDIVVRWYDKTAGTYRDIGHYNQRAGGGQYGGENSVAKVNYEEVFWPATTVTSIPDDTWFDICVVWYTTESLYARYSVEEDGVYADGSSWDVWVDTSLSRPTEACAPGVAGYLGSYHYNAPDWLRNSGSASVASADDSADAEDATPPPPAKRSDAPIDRVPTTTYLLNKPSISGSSSVSTPQPSPVAAQAGQLQSALSPPSPLPPAPRPPLPAPSPQATAATTTRTSTARQDDGTLTPSAAAPASTPQPAATGSTADVVSSQRDTPADLPQPSTGQPQAGVSDTVAARPQSDGSAGISSGAPSVGATAGPIPAPQQQGGAGSTQGTALRVIIPSVVLSCVVGVVVIGAVMVVWRRKSLAHSDGRVVPI